MATRLTSLDVRRVVQAARVAHGIEPDPASPWSVFRALQRHEQAAVLAGGVLGGLLFCVALPWVLAVLLTAVAR